MPGLETYGWLPYGLHEREQSALAAGEALYRRGPLPKQLVEYHGYYADGDQIVLSYSIGGRRVLERPTASASERGLRHTFRVLPGANAIHLVVGQGQTRESPFSGIMAMKALEPSGRRGSAAGQIAVSATAPLGGQVHEAGAWIAGSVFGGDAVSDLQWTVDATQRLILTIPPREAPLSFQVERASGKGGSTFYSFAASQSIRALREDSVPNLENVLSGGKSRWQERLVTEIKNGTAGTAYEKDEILLPEPNPWNAWMRTSAIGFFDDGRMVVTTHGGDVWLVTVRDHDQQAEWKRFAAGLYEPFGVQVVDGLIYLTCKDRLVRLHDYNGDDEADYYESFYADWDVSTFFHAFNFDLQRDASGYLYYVKSGQYTDFRLPGAVIRVAPDGASSDVIATGFRTPNGMGMLPDGRVTVGDNQGNWIPASKISLIRPGGFYGYVNNLERKGRWAPDGGRIDLSRVPVPKTFEAPLIWMPQDIDSSCGGQVWVKDERWGPLAGRMIHTSFGKARAFYLMIQEFDDVAQAALVRLPFQFQAGVQRARTNPADGQLYLVGLHGWNGGWPKELGEQAHGGVYRIRYTGRPFRFVMNARVVAEGLEIQLNVPIERRRLAQAEIGVEAWNYKWQQRYGSQQYSVLDPEQVGRDRWHVSDVRLGPDEQTLRIGLPDLQPCHQVALTVRLPLGAADWFEESILFTVNQVPTKLSGRSE